MLTIDSVLQIPAHVLFTTIENDAVLLNTETNKYYALNEVGARFWKLLTEGKILREAHRLLLEEYEVESADLEQDLLELVEDLRENGLVEITEPQAKQSCG